MKRKTSEIRKKQIIDVAHRLMWKEGIQGITLRNIAKEIKTSDAAIYRHFKGKREILASLIDDFEKKIMNILDSHKKDNKKPLEKLKKIMKAHMMFSEKEKGALIGVTAESINFNDDFLRRKVLQVIERYNDKIKSILFEAKERGFVRENINYDAVSLTFFGLIQAANIQFALTNYSIAPITKFNTFWNIFINGITPHKKTIIKEVNHGFKKGISGKNRGSNKRMGC